ncbi:lysoplasmalogenase [Sphingomonas sp. LB-2]|uniref:lysoplasmalogenase n=1 Tax=Sphingomonas caeni TaxID=2984949 RepID=UPI0022313891|nr:lysoplasmalogenase [Sphingomonas caeni]MCW3849216.1 lysoplasmalogenase [Sphingomonas caeni]
MRFNRTDWIFVAAIIVAANYFSNSWMGFEGPLVVAEKGAGVALLALWAGLRAPPSTDKWLIVAVMLFGALGDVLIEGQGNLTRGALAFLAGHAVAVVLYWRNRQGNPLLALALAIVVALIAFLIPADRAAAPGIALYAAGLGAMAGTAAVSRFPPLVGLGALLFVVSDLLIFSRMGPLHGSAIPDILVWPAYVGGQALIAWGVVSALARRA